MVRSNGRASLRLPAGFGFYETALSTYKCRLCWFIGIRIAEAKTEAAMAPCVILAMYEPANDPSRVNLLVVVVQAMRSNNSSIRY